MKKKMIAAIMLLLLIMPMLHAHGVDEHQAAANRIYSNRILLMMHHTHGNHDQYCITQNAFTDVIASLRADYKFFGLDENDIKRMTKFYRDVTEICPD